MAAMPLGPNHQSLQPQPQPQRQAQANDPPKLVTRRASEMDSSDKVTISLSLSLSPYHLFPLSLPRSLIVRTRSPLCLCSWIVFDPALDLCSSSNSERSRSFCAGLLFFCAPGVLSGGVFWLSLIGVFFFFFLKKVLAHLLLCFKIMCLFSPFFFCICFILMVEKLSLPFLDPFLPVSLTNIILRRRIR